MAKEAGKIGPSWKEKSVKKKLNPNVTQMIDLGH